MPASRNTFSIVIDFESCIGDCISYESPHNLSLVELLAENLYKLRKLLKRGEAEELNTPLAQRMFLILVE